MLRAKISLNRDGRRKGERERARERTMIGARGASEARPKREPGCVWRNYMPPRARGSQLRARARFRVQSYLRHMQVSAALIAVIRVDAVGGGCLELGVLSAEPRVVLLDLVAREGRVVGPHVGLLPHDVALAFPNREDLSGKGE